MFKRCFSHFLLLLLWNIFQLIFYFSSFKLIWITKGLDLNKVYSTFQEEEEEVFQLLFRMLFFPILCSLCLAILLWRLLNSEWLVDFGSLCFQRSNCCSFLALICLGERNHTRTVVVDDFDVVTSQAIHSEKFNRKKIG